MSMYSIYNILSGVAIGFLIGVLRMWKMHQAHKAELDAMRRESMRSVNEAMDRMKEMMKKDQ
ncbi:hypothetical protein KXR87_12955 [Yokenella regensburgei]|uniref:hypothetical protein n=1 Tax=Yokenella regensburgei TaxID=158877 RepID=UPI003F17A19D